MPIPAAQTRPAGTVNDPSGDPSDARRDALAERASARAVESLAAAIRFRTISRSDYAVDAAEFAAFDAWLAGRYPLCAARLAHRKVGEWGHLYEWRGRDPAAEGALFLAHYDVVPAPAGQGWEGDPFSGEVSGGFVRGRGALDVKLALVAILDCAEALLAEGFVPGRTLRFAFGGDEEVGGSRGAAAIGRLLEAEGSMSEYLVDEGAMILRDGFALLRKPVALIGVSEKGHVNFTLRAGGKAGHASMPPRRGAAGRLCAACAAIESRPFPPRLTRTMRAFLRALGSMLRFPLSLAFRHPGPFAPIFYAELARDPRSDAMVRSTRTVTMLRASPKENVMAEEASANLNVRLLPGDSVEGIKRRLERTCARHGVEVSIANPEQVNEALPESRTEGRAWERLLGAVEAAEPGAVPLPFQSTVGTDTRHYLRVARDVYRITPVVVAEEDIASVHSANEKLSVENLGRCVKFYLSLFTAE